MQKLALCATMLLVSTPALANPKPNPDKDCHSQVVQCKYIDDKGKENTYTFEVGHKGHVKGHHFNDDASICYQAKHPKDSFYTTNYPGTFAWAAEYNSEHYLACPRWDKSTIEGSLDQGFRIQGLCSIHIKRLHAKQAFCTSTFRY